MAIWVGTSGYNYPEWKGSFYPEKLPAAKMLPYYADRFPTVEINYTFYRAPTEKILDGWSKATPDPYRLTLKAPKRITHDARLRGCGDAVRQFMEVAATLGPKLGALLFQLPPNLKKDLTLFDAFLQQVDVGHFAAPSSPLPLVCPCCSGRPRRGAPGSGWLHGPCADRFPVQAALIS